MKTTCIDVHNWDTSGRHDGVCCNLNTNPKDFVLLILFIPTSHFSIPKKTSERVRRVKGFFTTGAFEIGIMDSARMIVELFSNRLWEDDQNLVAPPHATRNLRGEADGSHKNFEVNFNDPPNCIRHRLGTNERNFGGILARRWLPKLTLNIKNIMIIVKESSEQQILQVGIVDYTGQQWL